jgi:hypothetical protein
MPIRAMTSSAAERRSGSGHRGAHSQAKRRFEREVGPASLGSGEDVFVDRSEQEDEQRLREAMCERQAFVYAAMIRLMMRRLART